MFDAPGLGHNNPPEPTGRGGLTTKKFDEDQLQIAFVHLLRIDFREEDLIFTHIPNGGKRDKKLVTRGKNKGKWYSPEGAKLKAMGLLAGMSDLLFFWPGIRIVKNSSGEYIEVPFMECGLIEVKTESPDSRLSDEQKEVRRRVIAMGGRFAVARKYETVRDTLIMWGAKCQHRVTFT
jgi:hypothetical protein